MKDDPYHQSAEYGGERPLPWFTKPIFWIPDAITWALERWWSRRKRPPDERRPNERLPLWLIAVLMILTTLEPAYQSLSLMFRRLSARLRGKRYINQAYGGLEVDRA